MSKGRKFVDGNGNTKNTYKSTAADLPKFSDFQFVDTYLDAADKQWLEDNRDVSDELALSLLTDMEPGLKLSVSFDARSERFLATLADSRIDSPNKQKILTARGTSPVAALFALYYKNRYKSPEGVWGKGARTSDYD